MAAPRAGGVIVLRKSEGRWSGGTRMLVVERHENGDATVQPWCSPDPPFRVPDSDLVYRRSGRVDSARPNASVPVYVTVEASSVVRERARSLGIDDVERATEAAFRRGHVYPTLPSALGGRKLGPEQKSIPVGRRAVAIVERARSANRKVHHLTVVEVLVARRRPVRRAA